MEIKKFVKTYMGKIKIDRKKIHKKQGDTVWTSMNFSINF